MFARLLTLPLIVVLMGFAALAMLLPAVHAAALGDFQVMRVFFHSALLLLILTAMIAIATSNRKVDNPARAYLLGLLAAFAGLPVFLAVPFAVSVPDTSFLNAYVEMVSDITTTGMTLFDDPARLAPSVHLWRALVGWLGGLLVLVASVSILAPMNLGGFEVLARAPAELGVIEANHRAWARSGSFRLRATAASVFPVYTALTLVLWAVLLWFGDRPLVALSHAMSVLSTSGISPVGGLAGNGAGMAGEAAIFVMLIFSVSRRALSFSRMPPGVLTLGRDAEFRVAAVLMIAVSGLLFLRHWIGALQLDNSDQAVPALRALWGTVFTALSFLTTTGFESEAWAQARGWSGLDSPGMILMGLALVGGGVATTAGGVKLLRVFALFRHGEREMERLVYPSAVSGSGARSRGLHRNGALVAWVFFMLFGLALVTVTVLLAADGVVFENAVALSVAALSTTGPVLQVAASGPVSVAALGAFSKIVLAVAMVLGRLETLAIIALFNPDFWRR